MYVCPSVVTPPVTKFIPTLKCHYDQNCAFASSISNRKISYYKPKVQVWLAAIT